MHGYNVHEVFYLNYEIHDPRNRGLGPRTGPIQQYSENVLDFRKIFPLLQHMQKT